MKQKILALCFLFLSFTVKAQTYQETVDWLSQHISMDCFSYTCSSGRYSSSLTSITCDGTIIKARTKYSEGNTTDITIFLSTVTSVNTDWLDQCNDNIIKFITHSNDILVNDGRFSKTSHYDYLCIKRNCMDNGGMGKRIITALQHLAYLNKQKLPKEAF
ncbi:MAG: hypothetical protein JST07_00870 [Bacteroidetes bacterium]|nr:hypothetical protein [Bacteroidota bacterium]